MSFKRTIAPFRAFQQLDRWQQTGIFILFCLATFAPFVPGSGWDFLEAYRKETLTGAYGGVTWNPYPVYWLFYPFAILPPTVGFLLWNLLTAVSFTLTLLRTSTRIIPFALSLPTIWIFFNGQLEGAITLGLFLTFASNPIIVGAGLTLLSLKPQIGAVVILYTLLHRRNWRDLLLPALIYLLSLAHWGWWVPQWLASIQTSDRAISLSLSLLPYSLILLPLLWLKRFSLKIWLVVESMVMPYFAVYALAPLMCLGIPIWGHILIWLIFTPALVFEYRIPDFFIAPLLLGILLYEEAATKKNKSLTVGS